MYDFLVCGYEARGVDMRQGVIWHIDATWTSSGNRNYNAVQLFCILPESGSETIMLYGCSVYCLKAVLERFHK